MAVRPRRLPVGRSPARRDAGDQGILRILMIASEITPFAKTGGLADAVASLSAALRHRGHDVRVVIPRYTDLSSKRGALKPLLGPMGVWMGDTEEWCSVSVAAGRGEVPVYFIEFDRYYGRPGLYHSRDMVDFSDNAARFGFLARSALQLCIDIGFQPDIVHAHDWQAALAPAYLKTWMCDNPVLGGTASVLTVHNFAYQGKYPPDTYAYLGLSKSDFTPDKFEDHGEINFLKGGIHFADMINTVSPSHAREVTEPSSRFGLAACLSARQEDFTGILNGADYGQWSPATDPLIPARFSANDLRGKVVCKRTLQQRFGLPQNSRAALVGVVGRFVEQKGFSLIAQATERILSNPRVQLVVLGTGQHELERFFGELPARFPRQVGSHVGFSNSLAHLVEAGSDFFLMPSLYEPCGLSQMYALCYGTLPIVRATGGLDDTVANYDESTGEGTGFKFREPTVEALCSAVECAVGVYFSRPAHMRKLIRSAMAARFSWRERAAQYVELYRRAVGRRRTVCEGDSAR